MATPMANVLFPDKFFPNPLRYLSFSYFDEKTSLHNEPLPKCSPHSPGVAPGYRLLFLALRMLEEPLHFHKPLNSRSPSWVGNAMFE